MEWIRFNEPYGNEDIFKKAEKMTRNHLFEPETVLEQLTKRFLSLDLYKDSGVPFFMQSGTAALEIMALAMNIQPGDEIIIPSFTYPATANAFLRVGATLVFADIEPDTCNLDPKSVERVINGRTRAIVPIHYGGVTADLHALSNLAASYGAVLLEDAAHCIGAGYEGKPLGTFGSMGALSFHSSKNITAAGWGGCLLVENEEKRNVIDEIIAQGTDRTAFREGRVNAYRWKRLGGEYPMPVHSMAYLEASLENLGLVTDRRCELWHRYHSQLHLLETEGKLALCKVPSNAQINGHIFYLLLKDQNERESLKAHLHERKIEAFTHYEPLHDTVIGESSGRCDGDMPMTMSVAGRILRLPLHMGLHEREVDQVCEGVLSFFVH